MWTLVSCGSGNNRLQSQIFFTQLVQLSAIWQMNRVTICQLFMVTWRTTSQTKKGVLWVSFARCRPVLPESGAVFISSVICLSGQSVTNRFYRSADLTDSPLVQELGSLNVRSCWRVNDAHWLLTCYGSVPSLIPQNLEMQETCFFSLRLTS